MTLWMESYARIHTAARFLDQLRRAIRLKHYSIRKGLLGHADVKATMICTHVLNVVRGAWLARSTWNKGDGLAPTAGAPPLDSLRHLRPINPKVQIRQFCLRNAGNARSSSSLFTGLQNIRQPHRRALLHDLARAVD
jgi:hypothetical protein